jgi:hypothetical protein
LANRILTKIRIRARPVDISRINDIKLSYRTFWLEASYTTYTTSLLSSSSVDINIEKNPYYIYKMSVSSSGVKSEEMGWGEVG